MTRNTVTDRIDEMSANLKDQIKTAFAKFEHFFLAIDETCDTSGTAQLMVFIRACDANLKIWEELLELIPLHDTTTSNDICKKMVQIVKIFTYFTLFILLCSNCLIDSFPKAITITLHTSLSFIDYTLLRVSFNTVVKLHSLRQLESFNLSV